MLPEGSNIQLRICNPIIRDHGGGLGSHGHQEAGPRQAGECGEHGDPGQRRVRAGVPPAEPGHLSHLRVRGNRFHSGPQVDRGSHQI